MTAACDVPCVNNRAASNRRASNAALRRCPCCGVVMPQHRMVPDDNHHFISRDSLEVRMARVLFIVNRDHPELLASLRQEFAAQEAAGLAAIFSDRRQGPG